LILQDLCRILAAAHGKRSGASKRDTEMGEVTRQGG
jgi:hypothetical protein